MSGPQTTPYYRHRPRSIFGPLVLITIGVLFLLRTMGVIPHQTFHWWFVHYWPLLLILWGVGKLVEHIWARQHGEPAPNLGAGAVIFLIFFIVVGMGATRTANWNWGRLGNDWNFDTDFNPFDTRYEFTDNFAQPMQGASEIKVVSNQGDITVTPSEDAQAHVVIKKVVHSDSQESANKLSNSVQPRFTQQGNIWLLDLTNGEAEHMRFDLDLQLPKQTALSLSTHRGNLSVSERVGNVDLSSDNGNVSVDQIKGATTLHVRNGSVTAKGVTGNVLVDGEVDDGNIADITGTLEFNAGYNGTVELSHIAQQLHFKSVRTDLQLAKLEGEMTMGHGELRANSVDGPVKLNTRSNEVHFEDVSGAVTIENRNGLVEIGAKTPIGNIDVNSERGGIQLDLPEDASFKLDAQSISGNIDVSDFSVNVDNRSQNAVAHGTVGKGGPDIRLRSDRGTIQIRKQ
ncbi:MAG TPA: DUF4097 family beta strand repeat-containing protein [Candidatus Angelobacter sp.]|nr:DUF4097 family beta strand repeat-containing protein [Candidatus Angelobacter sp.]